MRISFIGLGNMGAPLAENMIKNGEALTIFSRRPQVVEHFAKLGAKMAHDILGLADCDLLCTCVPMPQDVLDLTLGENGLYSKMKPGSIHLELSTIDPDTARRMAVAAHERKLGYVQATVSKTPEIAAEGRAPFFVGGEDWARQKVMPLLRKIGLPEDVNTIEAACAIKLLSNLIGMSNIAILAEGMKIGALAQMDQQKLLRLLLDTGAASFQMKVRGAAIASDDFRPRFAVKLALKDLKLGCQMADQLGIDPKMMRQTMAYLEKAREEGLGEEDVCAIYKTLKTNAD